MSITYFSKKPLHTVCLGKSRGGKTGRILSHPGQRLTGNRLVPPDHGAGYLLQCGGDGVRVSFFLLGLQFPNSQPQSLPLFFTSEE